MKLISILTMSLLATAVQAEGFDYTKVRGSDAATYNALNQETTRLNTYTYGNSVAIQGLSQRADDTDLAQIGQGQRLDAHDVRFTQQDAINDALSSKLSGMYIDTAGLRSEARQARREARQAKAGAAAALAVAGQQMCTLRECGGQVALSGSTMGGYQAIAVGLGAPINDRWFVNGAFTQSGSVRGGVISTTYSFGR